MVQGPSLLSAALCEAASVLLLATDSRVLMRNVASTVAPIILVSSGSDTVSKGCSWCMQDVVMRMYAGCLGQACLRCGIAEGFGACLVSAV